MGRAVSGCVRRSCIVSGTFSSDMTILRDDTYSRGRVCARRYAIGGLHFALIFVSLALLVLSRLEHPFAKSVRGSLNAAIAGPVSGAEMFIVPLRSFWQRFALLSEGDREINRLKLENTRLQVWRLRAADLEREVRELKRLAGVADSRPRKVVTARVLAGANGVFGRSLLIGAGAHHGIHDGFPVLSAEGLIGRIVDAGDTTARVLLMDDVNSRIPVHVGEAKIRAIVAGDGSRVPRLLYLPQQARIKPGDTVVTSGAAGVLPAGFEVGRVVRRSSHYGVQLRARPDAVRYVSVERYIGRGHRLTGFLSGQAYMRRQQLQGREASKHERAAVGRRPELPVMKPVRGRAQRTGAVVQ